MSHATFICQHHIICLKKIIAVIYSRPAAAEPEEPTAWQVMAS